MTDTRGPATGKVPPHVKDRLDAKRQKAAQRELKGPVWARPPVIGAIALVALLIGLAVGIGLAGDPEQAVADELSSEVLPLANQAEAVWRTGLAGVPSVAEGAVALETADDTAAIEEHLDLWVAEHQRILDELAAAEVSPLGRSLRELFRGYVRAQLDGVVLLGAAASHDGSARAELLRAATREFARAQTLLREARVSLEEIGGPELPEPQVPVVPGLTRPGDPLPPPFGDGAADDAGSNGSSDETADDATDDDATDDDATGGTSDAPQDESSPAPSDS